MKFLSIHCPVSFLLFIYQSSPWGGNCLSFYIQISRHDSMHSILQSTHVSWQHGAWIWAILFSLGLELASVQNEQICSGIRNFVAFNMTYPYIIKNIFITKNPIFLAVTVYSQALAAILLFLSLWIYWNFIEWIAFICTGFPLGICFSFHPCF